MENIYGNMSFKNLQNVQDRIINFCEEFIFSKNKCASVKQNLIKVLWGGGGGGVVDEVRGNSERCSKWGGGGALQNLS